VRVEATAIGIQTGLRFLSLILGGIGLPVTILLMLSPPGRPGTG
jgi:hypothetical protein